LVASGEQGQPANPDHIMQNRKQKTAKVAVSQQESSSGNRGLRQRAQGITSNDGT
jgi:hypothetical protein